RFRELERLDQGFGRPSRCNPPVLLAPRQTPGAPAVRPQSFGHGAPGQPGKLSDRANSQLLQLLVAVALEREQRQRQRREELPRAPAGADRGRPGPRPPRGAGRGEAPPGGAGARPPRRAARGERAPERGLEPAVETLDPAWLEVHRPRAGRLDRE